MCSLLHLNWLIPVIIYDYRSYKQSLISVTFLITMNNNNNNNSSIKMIHKVFRAVKQWSCG